MSIDLTLPSSMSSSLQQVQDQTPTGSAFYLSSSQVAVLQTGAYLLGVATAGGGDGESVQNLYAVNRGALGHGVALFANYQPILVVANPNKNGVGTVAIGTTTPAANAVLTVNGAISATGLTVNGAITATRLMGIPSSSSAPNPAALEQVMIDPASGNLYYQ